MFQIIFGSIWTSFTGFMIYAFSTANEVTVNGVPVSHEEFSAMLLPKIILGIFLVVGLAILYSGLKEVLTNKMTSIKGKECKGVITSIERTGTTVNGRPELKAIIVACLEDNEQPQTFEEVIGFKLNKYHMGDIVLLKHYKNDVNIIRTLTVNEVTESDKAKLKDAMMHCNNPYRTNSGNATLYDAPDDIQVGETRETVIIDGQEYVKK